MIRRGLRLLLVPCLAASAPEAASNPFVGDWKLNPSKSTLTDRMTVERVGGTTYTFNFGGGPETIVVNGTDQRTHVYADGTLSVAAVRNTWKVVRKRNGRPILSANWTLSKDSSTLTDHFRAFNADGSPYTLNYVYKRTTRGSGFAGTWVSTSLEAVNYVIMFRIRAYGDNGLAFVDPASELTGNVQFPASSIRRLDEHTVELMRKKSNGEPASPLRLELSSDLHVLTMTSHAGVDPHIFVFDRQ